jgi:hypothetical protein
VLCYACRELASSLILLAESEIVKVLKHLFVLKAAISWDLKPCNVEDMDKRFRETCSIFRA